MDALRSNYKKYISLKLAKKLIFLILFVFLFDFFLFPMPVLANNTADLERGVELVGKKNDFGAIINHLPINKDLEPKKTSYHVITAYTSEIGQTDDTPCITANGFNLCDHNIEDTLAANFLPLGTKVRIPDLFGDRIFTIRDRMNARYTNRLDIWMKSKADAKLFGVKRVKIEILIH